MMLLINSYFQRHTAVYKEVEDTHKDSDDTHSTNLPLELWQVSEKELFLPAALEN